MTKTEINTTVINETNRFIKKHLDTVINSLIPSIGQKIILSDCETASKKFTGIKPEQFKIKKENYFLDIYCWYEFGSYSVILNVETCINGGSYDSKPYSTAFCEYYTKSIYVGKVKNQILTELEPINKSDFDPIVLDEINAKIKLFKEAKTKLSQLYYSIPEQVRKSNYLRMD